MGAWVLGCLGAVCRVSLHFVCGLCSRVCVLGGGGCVHLRVYVCLPQCSRVWDVRRGVLVQVCVLLCASLLPPPLIFQLWRYARQ